MVRFLVCISLVLAGTMTLAQTARSSRSSSMRDIKHLSDFQVIEFRRYTIKSGEREHFAQYFESYFPEAFQQLGAIAFGQFLDRKNPSCFTWIRGFHNLDARSVVNSSFYSAPFCK